MINNPYVKNIERIEFPVTYACTSRCRHCSVGAAEHPERHIDPEKAVKVVEDLCGVYDVDSVMTFGGEPLLYPDTVAMIHSAATRCGVRTRQIITNGSFTADAEKTAAVARQLVRSGVNNILLSVDAFHSEFLPLEHQYGFAKALCDIGFANLKLHPAWVVDREHSNPYNEETKRCLAAFSDLNLPVTSGNNIFPAGNARLYLSDYYAKAPLDFGFQCGDAPYTGKLDEMETVSVNPNGDVIFCTFPIGNIYEKDILTILADYDPYAVPAMAALLTGGIRGLCALAEESGITVDPSDYYSPCDLCRSVVRKLHRLS